MADAFVPYNKRPEWQDITPIPQDDGPNPLVLIAYSSDYTDAMNYFRAISSKNELSERALDLTTQIIGMNPAHYTIWYVRKTRLGMGITRSVNISSRIHLISTHPIAIQELPAESSARSQQRFARRARIYRRAVKGTVEELSSVVRGQRCQPRFPGGTLHLYELTLHSTQWLSTNHYQAPPTGGCGKAQRLVQATFRPSPPLQSHRFTCTSSPHHSHFHFIRAHPTTILYSSHRQWVITRFDLWSGELPYLDELLIIDVRNNSAWNHRYFVVFEGPTKPTQEFLEKEIEARSDWRLTIRARGTTSKGTCIPPPQRISREHPLNLLTQLPANSSILARSPNPTTADDILASFCAELRDSEIVSSHLLASLVDVSEARAKRGDKTSLNQGVKVGRGGMIGYTGSPRLLYDAWLFMRCFETCLIFMPPVNTRLATTWQRSTTRSSRRM
ncbi:hypothetical protein BC936DRAFT_145011 [Jimgerdemannia flammicorona]|uniref:Protein farnesyltransferase/geranylgeranyltransferase type-1 subunit alpha n=1 Tax=Jimgerdemannia flammicorona TaxID=994334 RepID=A0A433DB56_9FUNG|nr:hypothetical protein BC936DRAFT_145011 [Jimgerdemannia flammicorona]